MVRFWVLWGSRAASGPKISIPLWCGSEGDIAARFLNLCDNFNSTMVRFWETKTMIQFKDLPVFQFHYGAVLSDGQLVGTYKAHPISIPLWCGSEQWRAWGQALQKAISIPLWCGSEKAMLLLNFVARNHFNSTMVRFWEPHIPIQKKPLLISIPLWCGSEEQTPTLSRMIWEYFNSTMVRFWV